MAVFQLSGMAGIPQQVAPQRAERRDMNVLSGLAGLQGLRAPVLERYDRQQELASQEALAASGQGAEVDFALLGPIAADMERIGAEMAQALQADDMALYQQKAAEYDRKQGEYLSKSHGKQYKAQSLQRVAEMQKAIADAKKAGVGAKGDESKVRKDAISYIDSRLDKVVADKKKLIDEMRLVRKGAAMLEQVAQTDDPEQLFTVTKLLAQQIEPGMAVTEGEVRGFLGANSATNVINMVSSVKNGLGSLISGAGTQEAAYKAGTGSAAAVGQLRGLAKNLNQQAVKAYQTMINEGTANMVQFIKADIESAYGGAIDPQVLQGINSRVSGKLQAAIGTGAPIPTTGNVGAGEKTAAKPKPTAKPKATTEKAQTPWVSDGSVQM